jgi:hypothetical protein
MVPADESDAVRITNLEDKGIDKLRKALSNRKI